VESAIEFLRSLYHPERLIELIRSGGYLVLAAIVFVALAAFVSVASAVENPTGNWKSTVMLGKKSQDVTITLKLDGDKLTGTIGGGQGKGGAAISDGTFKDDKVSFSVVREQKGEKLTQKYSGTVSGDTIKGKIDTERGGKSRSTDWEAKRQ
jgi:hypothetical protein